MEKESIGRKQNLFDLLNKIGFVFSLSLGVAKTKTVIASFSFSLSNRTSVEDANVLERKVWGGNGSAIVSSHCLCQTNKKKKQQHSSLIIKDYMLEDYDCKL